MLFKLEKLSHRYSDGTLALDEVSLNIAKSERIALLGINGSGKTTLLKHLNGILKPTSGTVYYEDTPLEYNTKALLALRKKVGFIFQDPNDQLFAPTVKQEVAFGPLNLGYSQDKTKMLVDEALKIVDMSEFAEKPPHFLSLGQKKRVALAGVLAMQPEVIIMDEPTANLDPRATSEILHLLLKLNKDSGITLILATHDVDMVPLFATRLYILNKGKIIAEGIPKEIFSNAELIRSVNLRSPRITHLFEVLKKENNLPIADALKRKDLEGARQWLHFIVRRDPNKLDDQHVLSAAVESIAESTTDGVTSPFFFFALFGVPGAFAFRVVNTLDSMVGYKDAVHVNIGWFSAKLDTMANFIPARVTAVLMVVSAAVLGANWRNVWRILQRDKGKTASPNAGWTISAMAGALEVQLEKEGYYILGDEGQLSPSHVKEALEIMVLTAILFGLVVVISVLVLKAVLFVL